MVCRQASALRIVTLATILFALLAPRLARAAARPFPQSSKKASDGFVILDSSWSIFISTGEQGPVAEATQDLARDFESVFGKKPEVIPQFENARGGVIVIGEQSKIPEELRPAHLTNPESFSISMTRAEGKGPTRIVVVLAGADMRGTIYAIYEFSQNYLGVDPLYYWTDHRPAGRAQIEVSASLKVVNSGPVFKYRGLFINDEDLLTGWAPAKKGEGTGISLEVWNKIFETILRLKGNMVAPGTWIFPDEPQIKLAGKRGLILTQHHAIPLGLNVARWPKDVPYSYTSHPEILERAWKAAAAAYPSDLEVLWTVGLRGLSDASYAAFDPNVGSDDKALGELITKAMADQMQIVRSLHPDANFVSSLWQEGARLVKEGYLKIPPEVGLVWADTGYGYLQDNGMVAAGQGAYYHVAMYNARANQLSEMIPVERIDSELGRYLKAGATHYLLLNTSDIRPVSMTTKAVMDVGWKGLPPDASGESDRFYQEWSAEEFGPRAARQVGEIYKQYFATPAHIPGRAPALEYGDNYYHTEARRFLLAHMVGFPLYFLPGQSPAWVTPRVMASSNSGPSTGDLSDALKGEIDRSGQAQPHWDALWEKAVQAEQLVAPARRPFYRAHVLAMIAINKESNRILTLVAEAVHDAEKGDTQSARLAAQKSLGSFDEISKVEAAAEYGKWKNWYRGDWLTGIKRTRELVQMFLKHLDDPLSPMPPPVYWTGWEAYYHIMLYEGTRSASSN
jgi:hypothetical protein